MTLETQQIKHHRWEINQRNTPHLNMKWQMFEVVDDRKLHLRIDTIGGRHLYFATEFFNEREMSFSINSGLLWQAINGLDNWMQISRRACGRIRKPRDDIWSLLSRFEIFEFWWNRLCLSVRRKIRSYFHLSINYIILGILFLKFTEMMKFNLIFPCVLIFLWVTVTNSVYSRRDSKKS